MYLMGACRGLPFVRCNAQAVAHVYALHDQYLPLLFHLPYRFTTEFAFSGRNLARLQGAAKCPGKSAGSCRDQVVQGGGMGYMHVEVHTVMLSHLGMDSE